MKKEECIELIKSFIVEKLNGNIWNFLDYDLNLLENDEKYGGYDPDNSKIANAIYILLWGDKIPELSYEELGKSYRGDTINSFHTLMGFPTEDFHSFSGIQKYTNNENIISLAKDFHTKYHTIGNMVILPNHSLEFNGKKYTLNTARSMNPWYDYFDCFLREMKQALTNPHLWYDEESSEFLIERLVCENEDFAEKYFQMGKTEKFQDFIYTFYLEKYMDTNTCEIPQIFSPHAYHWNGTYSKEEYEQYVTSYITTATEIINYRGSRMIEDLILVLNNYDSFNKKPKIKTFYGGTTSVFGKFSKENIAYILLFITAAILSLYSLTIYIKFLLHDGYNTLPRESLGSQYFDTKFSNNVTYILFLSVFFISLAYRKSHKGIRKLLMTFVIVVQTLLVTFPLQRIIWRFFMQIFPSNMNIWGSLEDVFITILGSITIISIIIPFFIFLCEKKYRKFVKYWGGIFLMLFMGFPLIFAILSVKILAILCGIIIIVFLSLMFLQDLHYAIVTRCPVCKKISGLKYVSSQLLNEIPISVKMENARKDNRGNIIGTYEQYIPGKRKIILQTYKCKCCGYVQTKTITKETTSL